MRRAATGVVLIAAALAIAGLAATMFGTSLASNNPPDEPVPAGLELSVNEPSDSPEAKPLLKGNTQTEGDDEEGGDAATVETRPHLGLMVETLSEADADEMGISGGVLVRGVVEGGPSDGLLEEGDVITEVDGDEVTSAAKLVEIVLSSEPGDVITFAVLRNGEPLDVDVTVGAREMTTIKREFDFASPFIPVELAELMEGGFDSFVRAEVVVEAPDGTFKTIRAVKGNVAEGSVDEDAGTFSLDPKDGSDAIDYEVNDETRVFINHTGGIEGLNSEDDTLVVDVIDENGDSSVMIVVQGAFLEMIDRFDRGGFGPGMPFHHFDKGIRPLPGFVQPGVQGLERLERFEFERPEFQQRFRFMIPPNGMTESERKHLEEILPNIEELFENLPFDLDDLDIPDDAEIEATIPDTNA